MTNLFARTMPFLRYELTDEVTLLDEPCPCGCAHRRIADVQGRLDDTFTYAGVAEHPHVFRSVLGRCAQVVGYQARQSARGAEIDVRLVAPVDLPAVAADPTDALRRLGVAEPQVVLRPVAAIERTITGKLKRFVPPPGTAVGR